jgi:outer membrane protein
MERSDFFLKESVMIKVAIICLLSLLPLKALAAPAAAPESTLTLSLEECISMALKAPPELGESQADIELATSKLNEAKSYRYPQLEVTSLFGPALGARKEDLFATDRSLVRFNNMTWFTSTDATLIQPIYTFGKISENMKAATYGIEVDRSRKVQRSNEIVVKVREYYYGLLFAREMKELILEVQETLSKARQKAKELLEQESNNVEEMDLYKLDAFTGEVLKYLEEAQKGEQLALAALKARLGLAPNTNLQIKTVRLTLPDANLPDLTALVNRARERRPEFHQIEAGLKARTSLVEAAKANYYPDIFIGGLVSWAYADNRDRIHNPYIDDRFNHFNGGVALGARWKLDFGITGAKVSGEQAQLNRLVSTKEFAEQNIPLQVKKYYLELREAENTSEASKIAYTNAKKWAVTAVANFDFGIGPAKDIFEALQAYARMRAAFFQSIYNYHLAQANLDYATSEQIQSK